MAAATTDRSTARRSGSYLGIGLAAAAVIFAGCLTCYDADGYLADGADTAGLKFAGVSQEAVDNTGGADAALNADVWVEGQFLVASAGLTAADVGERVYLSDNQTVTKSVTNVYVGTIAEVVTAGTCWVDIDPAGQAGADGVADASTAQAAADALEAQVGVTVLANLTTTDQTGLQPAINEVDANADTAQADATQALADAAALEAQVGVTVLANLTTTDQTGLQPAINEVDANADANSADVASLMSRAQNETKSFSGIDDGTTDGKLKTTVGTNYTADGRMCNKAATDDLFDLTGEVDTGAGEWRAYWLHLNAAGASFTVAAATSDVSEADAISRLPGPADGVSVIGCYVAGNSCDFDGAAGLAGQGTIIEGWPTELSPSA